MGSDKRDRSDRIDEIIEEALNLPSEDRGEYLDNQCGDDVELRAEIERMLNVDPDFLDPTELPFHAEWNEAIQQENEEDRDKHAAIADRNMLYGIIAYQMRFVSGDSLIKAMHDWLLQKSTPIEKLLHDDDAIGSDTMGLLTALVDKHLDLHNGDAKNGLQSVSSASEIIEELGKIPDPDLEFSLAPIVSTGTTVSLGQPSSSGDRFRILHFHKEGGMGKVSLARDEELNREVAFKEIRDEVANDREYQVRLMVEAEITGGLEHPGIVPVYGLGTYDDGRPFYTMRFIKGDGLDDAIKAYRSNRDQMSPSERNLELRRLLRRFIDVCEAVHYAHSRMVLHRDLKPQNIMLGRHGETLVLDWGLAKAVGTESEHDPDVTRPLLPASGDSAAPTRGTIGTPNYMSPEQARDGEIGPATDVFSLGATLYYLLCGRAPYVVKEKDRKARERKTLKLARECQFPEPRERDEKVPVALNSICLKAMQKEPGERYESAQAFADDIERWLADEAVTAHRDPFVDRFARAIRRHRTAAAGIAVFLLTVLIASVVIAAVVQRNYQHELIAKQKLASINQQLEESNSQLTLANLRAEKDFETARELSFNLIDQAERELAQTPGIENTRKTITNLALDGFRKFFDRRSVDDSQIKIDMARLYIYSANLDRFYGEFQKAERKYARSLQLATDSVGTDLTNNSKLVTLAESHRACAVMYSASGRLTEAEVTISRARELAEVLHSNKDGLRILPTVLMVQANVEHEFGEFEKALELYKEAEQLLRMIVDNRVADSAMQATNESLLIMSQLAQSSVYRDLSQFDVAVSILSPVVSASEDFLESAGTTSLPRSRLVVAHAHLEMARVLRASNGIEENRIEDHLTRAVGLFSELNNEYPATIFYRQYLALSQALFADSQIRSGSPASSAKQNFDEAIRIVDQISSSAQHMPDVLFTCSEVYEVGAIHETLSAPSKTKGYLGRAIECLEKAIRLSESERVKRQLDKIQKSSQGK